MARMRFRSRTEAELAALKELSGSRRMSRTYHVCSKTDPSISELKRDSSDAFRARAEAELAALREQVSNVNPVAAYTAGLKTDSGADAFRSRTEAELASLKGVGGSMNPVDAYSAGLNRSITDSSRPGMESENSMTIDAATDTVDVVGDNNAESLRSRTEARLAALKEKKSSLDVSMLVERHLTHSDLGLRLNWQH
jgi:hypothetical protein